MIPIINCSESLRYFNVTYHILASAMMVLVFAVLERLLKHRRPLIMSEFHLLHKVYAVMIYVVASLSDLYLFGISGQWTLSATRIINLFFFIRMILVFLQENRQEVLATFVESWLMVHSIWEFKIDTLLYGYEFLSLARLGYYHTVQEFYAFFGRRGKLLRIAVSTLVVFTVMASMVEFAEETRVGECVSEDDITPSSSFSYQYMTLVSVATVGYGDITPEIDGSKILACLYFLTAIAWLQKRVQIIRSCMVGDPIPVLSEKSRVVLLWSGTADKLSKFLMDFSTGEDGEVLVVSETEGTEELEINNVTVFHRPEITSSLLRSLLADTLSGRDDRVIIVNSNERDASLADSRVFQLTKKVKEVVPHIRVIVHVQRSSTCMAVEDLHQWQPSDCIVCTEKLMKPLMAKTVAAAGAASLFCNLITPQHKKKTGDIKCAKWFVEEYFSGENLTLCSSIGTFSNAELFSKAAQEAYSKGLLLLGCWNFEQWWALPKVLPGGTHRVYLAPPKYVIEKQWVDTESTDQVPPYSAEEAASFVISDEKKKVYEIEADGNVKDVLGTNNTSPSVWVMRKKPSSTEYGDMSSYQHVCAQLRKVSPDSRLVTNIAHSLPSMLDGMVSDPYWHVDDVSENIIPSVVRCAHQFNMLYGIWKCLLDDADIVEVKVTAACTYGSLFSPLISRGMLPLGACVRLDDSMCEPCKKDYGIATPLLFPFTNPHPEVPVQPGDTVIALMIAMGGEEAPTDEDGSWSKTTTANSD